MHFFYCSSLAAITIPESVTSIGSSAFYDCSSLTTIIIPEGVTSIGSSAFRDCSSLTAITLPEGVTSIGNYAFSGCWSLTAITIPESVTSIEYDTFEGCTNLTSITIPESVTGIGSSAFEGCSSLTAITLPKGLRSIGSSAFRNCSSLTTITIPEEVRDIRDSAFEGCSSLTTITIKSLWLEYIGSRAFANCIELLNVYCYYAQGQGYDPNLYPPLTEYDAFDGSYPEYATLYVRYEAETMYSWTDPWSNFGTIEALISEITLDKTLASLFEGEELILTATKLPGCSNANLISWVSSNPDIATVNSQGKVTAKAPGTATITVITNGGSGKSASCEVRVCIGKCASPTIGYKEGKVVFACDTEEAIIQSNFKNISVSDYDESEVFFTPTYTITAYATKELYKDSDIATVTICWIPCTEEHESEETGILTIPSKPVLISARDGVLTLSGLTEGTVVTLYTTDGTMVAQQQSSAGETKFTVDTNQVYIVHIGDKVVKIGM